MSRLDSNQRDYGIDLLRIFSMIMIVLIHMLGEGGMMGAAGTYFIRHRFTWVWMSIVSCSVNIYALISGYVGVGTKPRLSSLMALWLQVVTYTVGCLLVGGLLWPESVSISIDSVLYALRPVTTGAYWYFTAYFALFFFMPALNHIVLTFSKKDLIALVCSCLVLFSVIPTLCRADLFYTKDGYSLLWLAVMYLTGGTIRRLALPQKGNVWIRIGGMIAIVLICVFLNYLNWAVYLHRKMFDEMYALFEYTAPTNVLIPIALIVLFADKRIPRFITPIIKILSPLTFGVYLLHVNPYIYGRIFNGRFAELVNLPPKKQILCTAAVAVGIYLACSLVDGVRALLFRLLRIKELCRWIAKKLTGIGSAVATGSEES